MLREVLVALTILCLTELVTGKDNHIVRHDFEGRRSTNSVFSHFTHRNFDSHVKRSHDYDDDHHHNNSRNDEQLGHGHPEKAFASVTTTVRPTVGKGYQPPSAVSLSLSNINLHLFKRDYKEQIVSANKWFEDFVPDKDVVILVHGGKKRSVHNIIDKVSKALVEDRDFNVIAVNWTYYLDIKTPYESEIAVQTHIVKMLAHALYIVFDKNFPKLFSDKPPKNYFIGEGLGTVVAVTFAEFYKKPFQYIYGLSPLNHIESSTFHRNYFLTQDHGSLVVTLSVRPDYTNFYAHRTYIMSNGGGNIPEPSQLLADIIQYGGVHGRYCSSAYYYNNGDCDKLASAPLWFSYDFERDKNYPTGKYFFSIVEYEFVNIDARQC